MSLNDAQDVVVLFDDNLIPQIDEQSERSKTLASVVVQAEEDAVDSADDLSVPSKETEQDKKLKDILNDKRCHIEESLNVLR